jgi:hypothetical protein
MFFRGGRGRGEAKGRKKGQKGIKREGERVER